eukprot:CAMPEP_0180304392 /NCGR_PEP_ID=MMETSP0988-20121125/25746_1 /TAXON_ID=697907 /ORGANISM="non described non described, Strain CCMP2293" /LENGTH=73 /DNA_ID=CAMNT_0022286511 /DNA_START=210 /DNA_END=427 /DNA_ORIENTATION=+
MLPPSILDPCPAGAGAALEPFAGAAFACPGAAWQRSPAFPWRSGAGACGMEGSALVGGAAGARYACCCCWYRS